MLDYTYIFKRTEKKYLLSKGQYESICETIAPYMSIDKYGLSTINNIYFDTDNYDLIRRSISKPPYKEKLRLRGYGEINKKSTVFIELKKKYKGTVFKRRVSMSLEEAENYLYKNQSFYKDTQIFNEIDYFLKFYNATPKIFIAYDRKAYYCLNGSDLRVTFDRNIRSRYTDLSLSSGSSGDILAMEGYCLMEIKTAYAMPLWLASFLSREKIYPTSFSKYGKVYSNLLAAQSNTKYNLLNEKESILCSQV